MPSIVPIAKFKKDPFSSNKVRARVLNELKRQGKIAKAYMALTVEYWNDVPNFDYAIFYKNASPQLVITPDMYFTSTAAEHWIKVNNGTAVEYARYTHDFRPKTEPGQLGGNIMGQGLGFYSETPRKGIEARGWTDLIQKAMEKDFTISIGNAIKKGLESE